MVRSDMKMGQARSAADDMTFGTTVEILEGTGGGTAAR